MQVEYSGRKAAHTHLNNTGKICYAILKIILTRDGQTPTFAISKKLRHCLLLLQNMWMKQNDQEFELTNWEL